MTVKEFIENFNIIDRNVYIYPKTKKDLTNTDGDRSPYILAIHKYKDPEYLEKSCLKYSKRLSRKDFRRLYTITKSYTLEDLLNSEVWRVSTDCSWYDRVPPICLYINDIELVKKKDYKKLQEDTEASPEPIETEEETD